MEIAELSDMSDEILYAKLGEVLLGEGRPFGVEDLGRHFSFAKAWLAMKSSELRRAICGSRALKYARSKTGADAALDMAAVAELLMKELGNKEVAVVVSVIVMRRGLQVFCAGQEL